MDTRALGKTIRELSVGETHGVYPADTGSGAVDTVLLEVSSVERVSGFDTGVSAADHITNSDTVVFKVTFTETVDVSTPIGRRLRAGRYAGTGRGRGPDDQ